MHGMRTHTPTTLLSPVTAATHPINLYALDLYLLVVASALFISVVTSNTLLACLPYTLILSRPSSSPYKHKGKQIAASILLCATR